MSLAPKYRWLRVVLGYLTVGGVVVLAATPVYFLEVPTSRPLVVRAGATLLAGIALIHVRRIMRARVEAQPPSAFDRALRRPRWTPGLAPQFIKLRNEVRFSLSSHAYFSHVLWVRLQALAARRGASLARRPSPHRRLFGRGPALATLRMLLTDIEERS